MSMMAMRLLTSSVSHYKLPLSWTLRALSTTSPVPAKVAVVSLLIHLPNDVINARTCNWNEELYCKLQLQLLQHCILYH